MKCGARVALGVAGGYFLGRTKKMKLALMLGGMAAGRQAGGPGQILTQGTKLMKQSPELSRLTDEVRGRLLEAGKGAAMAVAVRQLESLTDRVGKRVESLGDIGSGRPSSKSKSPRREPEYDDEYEDDEEYEDQPVDEVEESDDAEASDPEAELGANGDGGDERAPRRETRRRTATSGSVTKAAAQSSPSRTNASRSSSATTTAKRTAGSASAGARRTGGAAGKTAAARKTTRTSRARRSDSDD